MADTPPHPTHTPEGVPIPAFTPWTGERRRGSGWTPQAQALFIAALTRLGCVAAAAQVAGRSVRSAYRLRDRPGAESFAAAWASAAARGREVAQDVAIERAIHGKLEPVFRAGHFLGYRVAHNDRLLAAVLTAGKMDLPMDRERARLEIWEARLRALEANLVGGTIERDAAHADDLIYQQEVQRMERSRRAARIRAAARADYSDRSMPRIHTLGDDR